MILCCLKFTDQIEEETQLGSVAAVAQWMWEQLQKDGYLEEEWAISQIQCLFSSEYLYRNNSGNVTIKGSVKRRFRQMYEDQAKWYPLKNEWRMNK